MFPADVVTGCQKQQDQSQPSKHQVFKHTTVSHTNQLTRQHVLYLTRWPVSVDWSFLFLRRRPRVTSASFSEIHEGRSDPTSSPVRRTTYLFTQSVTVCSMYIDDPSLCIYKKCTGLIQLFTLWLFFVVAFSLIKVIAIFL